MSDSEKRQTELIETVSNFVHFLGEHDKNHLGLKGYRAVVKATKKSKKNNRKLLIDAQEKVFRDLFYKFKDDFLNESFVFLLKQKVELFLEDTPECSLPLSDVYNKLSKVENDDAIVELEAMLYNSILRSLEKGGDYDEVAKICTQYVEEKKQVVNPLANLFKGGNVEAKGKTDKFVKELMNTVKNKMSGTDVNNANMMEKVGPMFKELTEDKEVKAIMEDVTKGDIGIMDIFGSFLSNITELENDKKVKNE